MNYKQSTHILAEVKKAKRVLLTCHKDTDTDSVCSNLAMGMVLTQLEVDYDIVNGEQLKGLDKKIPGSEQIQIVDLATFDASKYDLWLVLDFNDYSRSGIQTNITIPVISLDHHPKGDIDSKYEVREVVGSTTELLFNLFTDWEVKMNSQLTELLLLGLLVDTNYLKTSSTQPESLEIVAALMRQGADTYKIYNDFFRSYSLETLKSWGWVLQNLNFEPEYRLAWVAMPAAEYAKYSSEVSLNRYASDNFITAVGESVFGIGMTEKADGLLSISVRSKDIRFPIDGLCKELGGGGHPQGGGGIVEGLPFSEAVEKVLKTARKYYEENKYKIEN